MASAIRTAGTKREDVDAVLIAEVPMHWGLRRCLLQAEEEEGGLEP